MKKYLPLILLFAGVLILVGAFLFVRGNKKEKTQVPGEEMALLDLPLEERPLASLTPTPDGHYLNMKIEKIGFGAFSLDYELLYQVPGGLQQGVPGSVNVTGKSTFEAELLLGSESSGKFRYDEGVEEGSLTLRFRNEEGQLLARFTTDFHLQTATGTIVSPDNLFKYELDKENQEFFISMNTVGIPGKFPGSVGSEAYGIFTSALKEVAGKIDSEFAEIYYWDGDNWQKTEDNNSSDVGIFISGASD